MSIEYADRALKRPPGSKEKRKDTHHAQAREGNLPKLTVCGLVVSRFRPAGLFRGLMRTQPCFTTDFRYLELEPLIFDPIRQLTQDCILV
jgi:hypothetical protein